MTHIASDLFRNIPLFIAAVLLLGACGGKQMNIEEFQTLAREAEETSSSIASCQESIRDLLQAYNQTVLPARRLELQLHSEYGLSADEMKKLVVHIESEGDESCRGILLDIVDLQDEIDDFHERLHDITDRLPAPHRVARGENHYMLCLDYLMQVHGLSQHRADSLVARVALTGDIIEGFHVWFLYQDEVFGTFVTQGDAHISPTVFAKVVKNHLLEQARRQGRNEAFESILDSLKRSGALLANLKKAADQ
ncbi:MAG: hypothetical protein RRA94_11170 [Bacteroidota bacterium]|nr:hypothetical protein [Bacteroidota bacterium]